MFVAWRDLRFARGRFVLIGTVVALITLLVGFLAGLTGGLASQNVSGVLALPGDRLVLQSPDGAAPMFGQSEITEAAVTGWEDAAGVTSVTSVGIAQTRAEAGGQHVAVAIFGMPAGTTTSEMAALAPTRDGDIGLSAGAAKDLGVAVGDSVTIAGTGYRVGSIGADVWYSHTPTVAMTPKAWTSIDETLGGDGRPTVLAVSGDADWSAVAASTGTSVATPLASLPHLETFRSEVGSLGLMIAMLFGVSALVVGAFFTVWIMQRAGDVAVLKALGASTRSLVRDALGQALVVLVAGTGVGLLAVVGLGALAGSALPFVLNPLTTLVPAVAMVLLGLVGAAVALRPVTAADPLTALGSNR